MLPKIAALSGVCQNTESALWRWLQNAAGILVPTQSVGRNHSKLFVRKVAAQNQQIPEQAFFCYEGDSAKSLIMPKRVRMKTNLR
jgi:hypothetical protein